MLEEEQDMNAVGDGLAAEDDTHAARTGLQEKAGFGRWDRKGRLPYHHILKMKSHARVSFSPFKAPL
jgi:hypothetical protein